MLDPEAMPESPTISAVDEGGEEEAAPANAAEAEVGAPPDTAPLDEGLLFMDTVRARQIVIGGVPPQSHSGQQF